MTRRVRRTLLVSALLFGSPAIAQQDIPLGSRIGRPSAARIPDHVGMSDATRGRIALTQFARCTLERNPRGVQAALTLPDDGAWATSLQRLASPECLDAGEMTFSSALLRGALFVEIWKQMAARDRRPAALTFQPIDLTMAGSAGLGTVGQRLALLSVANCVVTADRVAASDLIAMPTGSARQAAAYLAINPLLGPCLPQGATFRFSKSVIEGALAEVLVRTVAPSVIASKAP